VHPIKLARIAIRSLLQANKKGVILTVASLAGYQGAFAAPLYCASKHTVVGFTRSMGALDELEGIKIVLSAPG
jgi:NAD(P)-dependent dehydrogenase (short-subunit alcohol dehydrogenase family)